MANGVSTSEISSNGGIPASSTPVATWTLPCAAAIPCEEGTFLGITAYAKRTLRLNAFQELLGRGLLVDNVTLV